MNIKNVGFVGDGIGGLIFTEFQPAFDAMFAIGKILEMMALTEKRLGEIDNEIPRLYSAKRNVNCSWEHKGKVMRRIMKDSDGSRRDLVDGVKIVATNSARGAYFIPGACNVDVIFGDTRDCIQAAISGKWRGTN